MKLAADRLRLALSLLLAAAIVQPASAAAEVLATVGTLQVTSEDLNLALGSSPFSTQFNAMDEDDQAGLRGDMLRRLVAARLMTLEARRLGLDRTRAYQQDVEAFRRGLLYRHYNERLRDSVAIPPATMAEMKRQFERDADGLAAAKAAWVAAQYRALKQATLENLMQTDRVVVHEERIRTGISADTVLMESRSFRVRYADIVDLREHPSLPNPEWVKDQLYRRGELLLFANAAEREGVDVSRKLVTYQSERLPSLMLESKTEEWVPDEATLIDWFNKHPDLSVVPERRHVGQLVVATRKDAEDLRRRIVAGESLFTLAGQYSVDPVSRKQNGDMGWIVDGRGMPELDRALSTIADGQLTEVIETKVGFHLLTILERQPGRREAYQEVRDRVRQLLINEKLRQYLGELERRYPVSWKVLPARTATVSAPASM
jgi:parvulin-like peptidyl-prolyl isomerase